jgi:hypothetical protein
MIGQGLMSHRDEIQALISKHNRRLQILKQQKAQQGITADPTITIEI